jgi:excisionase family DNA binding protein
MGFLTVKQAAQRLGVSAATVYGLCQRDELGHVRVANSIRISQDDLGAFLRAAANAPSRRGQRPSNTDAERRRSQPSAPADSAVPLPPIEGQRS